MRELFRRFFQEHSECSLKALGARANRSALDLEPFGQPMEFLDAEAGREWVERYWAANRSRFAGETALPRWVLSDLYLMPAAVGLLVCPARYLSERHRPKGVDESADVVAAAYYAAPSVVPGTFIGVSSFSLRGGVGAGALVKAATLKMLRATVQRGVTQWANPALRSVHTRMGVLKVEGIPVGHGLEKKSFVYSVDLSNEVTWRAAMEGQNPEMGGEWVPISDEERLSTLAQLATAGQRVEVLPPGLSADGKRVRIRTI